MSKLLSYCGLDCFACPAFLAHKNDDQALREKTAPEWSKMYNADIRPGDINCVGCVIAEGVHIGHCGECEYRKCGLSRELKNCGECPEYPCAKLAAFHQMVPDGKKNLDDARNGR
jgi:hypothetical protein